MSCGNATCASINQPKPISALLPGLKWPRQTLSWRLALEWLIQIARRCERRSASRELLRLDGRLLADIGLSRDQLVDDDLRTTRAHLTMWHVDR